MEQIEHPEMDSHLGPRVCPVWLVIEESSLCSQLKNKLESDQSFRLQASFSHWKPALVAARNLDCNCKSITIVQSDLPPHNEFNWLSAFVDAGEGVIVLLDDLSEENLSVAIGSGVSGFLMKSSPICQILSAIKVVADGGVVMSPEVLKLIKPSAHQFDDKFNKLTHRESAIIHLLAEGYSSREIAHSLSISYLTVRTHIRNIQKKLGICTVSGLVSFSFRNELL